MPYGAKNGTVNGTDFVSFGRGEDALLLIPGLGHVRPAKAQGVHGPLQIVRHVPDGKALRQGVSPAEYVHPVRLGVCPTVDGMCLWSLPITAAEVVLLLLSMIPVERALKENFDENGRRRAVR